MGPIVTPHSIDLAPEKVIAAVLIGVAAGLIAFAIRRFLVSSLDELGPMGRSAGEWVARSILRRRTGGPLEPWLCTRCRSANIRGASVCYRCGGDWEELAALPTQPDGESMAGPRAGRADRPG